MNYNTEIVKIDSRLIKPNLIKQLKNTQALIKGGQFLRQGEVVAFPTETVYGLGADATDSKAVNRIFEAKGRPQDNPLIVHVSKIKQVQEIISGGMTATVRKLIKAFWPGPLTLIFPVSDRIPRITTAGLDTVAVRMPQHPVALALIECARVPLAAPSANSSGYPSPTLAQHVYHDLKGKIPLIIDGGQCQIGLESTVIDVRDIKPVILRPGGVTREELEVVLGSVIENRIAVDKRETPSAPGMKYRHYSPVTPLQLIERNDPGKIEQIVKKTGKKIALVVTDETAGGLKDIRRDTIIKMGSRKNPEEIAQQIFSILRKLDQEDYDLILVEKLEPQGLAEAIMNRLHKAATNSIYF